MPFHIGINNILVKDGKVLLGKRLKKAGYGQWGFPGGHLEEGESLIAAAKRELFEETNLIGEKFEFANIINTPQPEHHYLQINFAVVQWSGVFQNKEPDICEQWEWFDLKSLPEVFTPHKDILDALANKRTYIDT